MALALPLGAQAFEAGLFLGRQGYSSVAIAGRGPSPDLGLTAEARTVYAARFGYTVTEFPGAALQLTAGFQPEFRASVKDTLGTPGRYLKERYGSVGAMVTFKTPVALGAGLEFRSERLAGNQYGPEESTTYNRVWARMTATYVLPSPGVKPFVGLEAAVPLTTQSASDRSYTPASDALKEMAPRYQLGLFAGIRF